MSTRKGRQFEYYVRDYCRSLGLKAERKILSGGNLRRPYDVLVGGKLHVEAKRRMVRDAFPMEGAWLDEIRKWHVLVFAAGKHPGKPIQLKCAFLPSKSSIPMGDESVQRHMAMMPVVDVMKYKTIPAQRLEQDFIIRHGGKTYLVWPFLSYLQHIGMVRKQNGD